MSQLLDRFRLLQARQQDDPKLWLRQDVYLSDACIAVHIKPGSAAASDAAKDALYGYLWRVSNTAIGCKVIRPVVGVVEATNDLKTMLRKWSADQEWHRGNFTLYVEEPAKVEERLEDVLTLKLEQINRIPKERRTVKKIIQEVEKRVQSLPDEEIRQTAEILLPRVREYVGPAPKLKEDKKNKILTSEETAKEWAQSFFNRADEIAEAI